ncbi:hypothetical protein [Gimibacter soli]|uniref:Uncharacterized protein n=1 Tax=Gimibacter soli TaxID=3024400 RepID=A0AAE9XW98_9PROT|nr:hypothetical protein [Gimibacter soli]WCL54414.1 hypothetical protein PH603_01405 [Gimibacter soli]
MTNVTATSKTVNPIATPLQVWIEELDAVGAHGDEADLRDMLASCPDLDCEEAQLLIADLENREKPQFY